MPQLYSLDDSITEFFGPFKEVTRQICDEAAASIVGLPVNPCPIQGCFSYTVYAGPQQSKVVQFRSEQLKDETLQLAKSIYGSFVPSTIRHDSLGSNEKIYVWEADRISGITYVEASIREFSKLKSTLTQEAWRRNLIMDYARFFSLSWKKPLKVEPQRRSHCQEEVMQRLGILATGLPTRFSRTLLRLSEDAHQLFSNSYPFTLTHFDLCQMNILVDPLTGHLTGVVDWIDAKIQPFGFALWGLQNILGHMDKNGWHFCESYKADEELFWNTLENEVKDTNFGSDDMRKVKIARYIGIFFHYGLKWAAESDLLHAKHDDPELQYLDAFLDLD